MIKHFILPTLYTRNSFVFIIRNFWYTGTFHSIMRIFAIFQNLLSRSGFLVAENGREVYCWGSNDGGQLGLGREDKGTKVWRMRRHPILSEMFQHGRYRKFSVGYYHTLVLTDRGICLSMGGNTYKQIARSGNEDTPGVIECSEDCKWRYVQAGLYTSFFINMDGVVFAAGRNGYGGIGMGSRGQSAKAERIPTLEKERTLKVEAGDQYTVFMCESGNCYSISIPFLMVSKACGYGGDGRLPSENPSNKDRMDIPTLITFFSRQKMKVKDFSVGSFYAVFVTEKGRVFLSGHAYTRDREFGECKEIKGEFQDSAEKPIALYNGFGIQTKYSKYYYVEEDLSPIRFKALDSLDIVECSSAGNGNENNNNPFKCFFISRKGKVYSFLSNVLHEKYLEKKKDNRWEDDQESDKERPRIFSDYKVVKKITHTEEVLVELILPKLRRLQISGSINGKGERIEFLVSRGNLQRVLFELFGVSQLPLSF